MLIVGAKGFAKELLEVCHELGETENLVFYDDVSSDLPEKLYNRFIILRSEKEVKTHFANGDVRFALGLGGTGYRKQLSEKFIAWGGELTSLISPRAHIAHYGLNMGNGATILAGATITGDANIGRGLLMYPNAVITHGCEVGDFVEFSPGATLLGNSYVRNYAHIGANATILPNIVIGTNAIVGAGAVVTRNVLDDQKVKGAPAR